MTYHKNRKIECSVTVCWMDDSGGVVETCHLNGSGTRDETYVGEIMYCLSDGKKTWIARLKDKTSKTFHDVRSAKNFVECSVDGYVLESHS